jgi:hypothetical protein
LNDLSKMSEIQDLLKCALCIDIFTGTPVILPCCYKTVCEHHTENQDKTVACRKRKLFTCILCETSHDMDNCKKFASNETIEKLLKIQIDMLANLGDIYVETINQIKSLEENFCKANNLIKDPKNFIFEKIHCIKREADLRKENSKKKIDEIYAEVIAKLDKYQQDCYENIQSLNLEDKFSDVLLEAQKYIDEWTKDNNQLLIVANDSKRKEIQTKVKELDINLFARYETLKEELMMNKAWFYIESETVVNDFQKELKQFEE